MSRRSGVDVHVRVPQGEHAGQVPSVTVQVRAYWPYGTDLAVVEDSLRRVVEQAVLDVERRMADDWALLGGLS